MLATDVFYALTKPSAPKTLTYLARHLPGDSKINGAVKTAYIYSSETQSFAREKK